MTRALFRTLAATTALVGSLAASPSYGQLVSSGDLVVAVDAAGNPGQITFSNPNASTANISVLAPAVISNWNRFNVPNATTLNISNASGAPQAALMARVVGANFSDMGGTVNANGVNLWLLNSNGILFGSNANINASSFFASTLGLTDADFFDAYTGSNSAGNGSDWVHFSGPSASTAAISAASGSRFTTDGPLFFVGPSLSLNGNFNAGSGSATFIAATDVSVGISNGDWSMSAGTTVANQIIAGTIVAENVLISQLADSGVSNALLRVDATVQATNASATNRGVRLTAFGGSGGSGASTAANVRTNGPVTSGGRVEMSAANTITATQAISGSEVTLNSRQVATSGMTATAGSINIGVSGGTDGVVSTGALAATTNIAVNGGGSVTLASAVADSDSSGLGMLNVGNLYRPTSVTIGGASQGQGIRLNSSGNISLASGRYR